MQCNTLIKGSCKGDIDIGMGIDDMDIGVDMDIDSDMAFSVNSASFIGCRGRRYSEAQWDWTVLPPQGLGTGSKAADHPVSLFQCVGVYQRYRCKERACIYVCIDGGWIDR